MKITRKYNLTIVKKNHCYTFEEISELFSLDMSTVYRWHRKGLTVIDEHSRPYLVHGLELKKFLRDKSIKNKYPLKHNEFFCSTCRCQCRSKDNRITLEITQEALGKRYKRAYIRGICEKCGLPLLLFSSNRKIQELIEAGLVILENKEELNGSTSNTLKAKFKGGANE